MTVVMKTTDSTKGRKNSMSLFALSALSLFMAACSSSQLRGVPDTQILSNMEELLEDAERAYDTPGAGAAPSGDTLLALMPGMSISDDLLTPVAERFNVVANGQNAVEFFNNLVAGTEYGVVVSPDISGQISINLPGVTIEEVMQSVQDIYGYHITRRGNIFHVQSYTLETRIFTIDYLNVAREGVSSVTASSNQSGGNANNSGYGNNNSGYGNNFGGNYGGGFGNSGGFGNTGFGNSGGLGGNLGRGGNNMQGSQVSTQTQTDFWTDIKATLEGMLGLESSTSTVDTSGSGLLTGLGTNRGLATAARDDSGKSVVVQPQVGMVMVTATPRELDRVANYIEVAQDILSREVTIQVQFLEVILNKGFQSAIDFDTFGPGGAEGGNNTVTGEFAASGSAFDGISNPLSIATNFTDFNAVFRILESRGTTQVLSSPSLKVLNNQKALFQDGDQEFFQTSVGSSIINTGSSVTESSANNLQQFFSGISMDITPQISADGTITLHVHPMITTVNEQSKSVAGEQVPLARTSVRELDSIIRAQDGRIVVLGGLAYERNVEDSAGIPVVNDIPVLGAAFDQRRQRTVKSEFIILLRPVIASSQSEQELLRERSERLRRLNNTINPFNN